MGLFEKLRSLLGLGEHDEESTTDDRDVSITVEREAADRRADGDSRADAGETATGPTAGGVSASDATATPGTGSESETATATGAAATPEPEDSDAERRRVPSEAVDVIKGIGPTYAGRLSDAGIETVADLAAADAADVADRADVPESRLEDWIERAKNRER